MLTGTYPIHIFVVILYKEMQNTKVSQDCPILDLTKYDTGSAIEQAARF